MYRTKIAEAILWLAELEVAERAERARMRLPPIILKCWHSGVSFSDSCQLRRCISTSTLQGSSNAKYDT
jgi:hypothetical protein